MKTYLHYEIRFEQLSIYMMKYHFRFYAQNPLFLSVMIRLDSILQKLLYSNYSVHLSLTNII